MRRALVFLLAIIGVSCSLQESSPVADCLIPGNIVFYGTTEQTGDNETKVYVDEHLKTVWHANDRITIFNRNTVNAQFRFNGQTGTSSGSFSKVQDDGSTSGDALSLSYAVYPYNEDFSISSDGSISGIIPGGQAYEANSFDRKACLMLAASDNNTLQFKNLCGVLLLRLYGAGSVSSIVLTGNNSEDLCGYVNMSINPGGTPSFSFVNNYTSTEITLNCSDPVALAASSSESKDFWLVVPPTVFQKGFTITVRDADGKTFSKSTPKQVELNRNCILAMAPVEVAFEEATVPIESITCVPQFEYNGVPALKYDYLMGDYGVLSGTAYETYGRWDYEEWEIRSNNSFQKRGAFMCGSKATAQFNVSPENALIDNADWAFRTLEASQSTPHIVSVQREIRTLTNVVYDVSYLNLLTNPENDMTALIATDKAGGNSIVSDDVAIVPLRWTIKALAFSRPHRSGDLFKGIGCDLLSYDELYSSAKDAAASDYSFSALYDGGGYPLDFIGLHLIEPDLTKASTSGSREVAMVLHELQHLYPGFEIQYEIIDATCNGESTRSYGIIEDNVFYPAFPDENGKPIKIDDTNFVQGRKAIGKSLIILAKLVYKHGNTEDLIGAGYFKIYIVREVAAPVIRDFVIADMGEFDYNGKTSSKSIILSSLSSSFESNLGMDYQAFRALYSDITSDTYYKKGDSFIRCGYSYNGYSQSSKTNYGTVELLKDTGNNLEKDKINIILSPEQAANIGEGNSVILYKRFDRGLYDGDFWLGDEYVYLGFKVKVGERPVASFSQKNPVYWYNDVSLGEDYMSTLRVNTWIPNSSFDDVTIFTSIIDNSWIGGKVQVYLNGRNNNLAKYKYRFASNNQPIVNGKKLYKKDDTTLTWNNQEVIKIIDESSGLIQLLCNETTKELLSWSTSPRDINHSERMLYCVVELTAYLPADEQTGSRELELNSEQFAVRFIRPLTFSMSEADHLTEGVPGGSFIEVGKYFSAIDWIGNKVFYYDNESGTYQEGYSLDYYGNPVVNWCQYYGISEMKIDVAGVLSDQIGSFKPLNQVNPAAFVDVIYDGFSYSGVFTVPLSPIENLSKCLFRYSSNTGVVVDFTLRIPITLVHAWGTCSFYLDVPVYGIYH